MEWIQDVIGVVQLPEIDELQSCALISQVSQHKLSVKYLKDISLVLQEEKAKCFNSSEQLECGEIQAADSIYRSNKGEIISELISSLEQSSGWLISQEKQVSQCEKQMRLISNCIKDNRSSEIRLFINENGGDAQMLLRNKLRLLQGEEKKLRDLWKVISSLLKATIEPKPFVDTDNLTRKVYNIRNDFYSLEEKVISCLHAYKEMIRTFEGHERKHEHDPSISVHGVVVAIIIFVVAFVLLFIVLITLMMDDLLSNFISVYHHRLAPS